MAQWNGTARSNYFRVKNAEIFKSFIEEYVPELEVQIETVGANAGAVMLMVGPDSDSGGWPTFTSDLPANINDLAKEWASIESIDQLSSKGLSKDSGEDEIDEEGAEEQEYDLPALICPFLVDWEIVVMMEAGAERLKYITGEALAFDHTGQMVQVSLRDIYKLAKEKFGTEPSRAEY